LPEGVQVTFAEFLKCIEMLCSQTFLQSSNNRLLEQLQCEESIEFKVILNSRWHVMDLSVLYEIKAIFVWTWWRCILK